MVEEEGQDQESGEAQHDLDAGVGIQAHLVGVRCALHVLGRHIALDGHLVRSGRADLPGETHEQDVADRHPLGGVEPEMDRIPVADHVGVEDPVRIPELEGDEDDDQDGAEKHDAGLDRIGQHDGPHSPEGRIDQGGQDQDDGDEQGVGRIDPEDGDQRGRDRRIHDRGHPQETQEQEEQGGQQAAPLPQLDLQDLVRALHVQFHEARDQEALHDEIGQRIGQAAEEEYIAVADHLPRERQIAERTHRGGEQGEAHHGRVHVAAAQDIIRLTLVAARDQETQQDHQRQEDADDDPVEHGEPAHDSARVFFLSSEEKNLH